MSRWRALAVVLVVAATAATAAACGGNASGQGSASGGGSTGGTLTLVADNAPSSYNPARGGYWDDQSAFFQAVYDTLLTQDSKGDLEPWLATSWTYNADKTVLTLKLRNDVTFSDGTKLTADAAMQSLEHFRDGTSQDAGDLAGTTYQAPSATTLVIKLAAPDPALLTYLSEDPGLVAAPSTWTNSNSSTDPVGSGPYVLDSASSVIGSTYVYTANKKYWDAKAVHYSSLTIKVLNTTSAITNAISTGQANASLIIDSSTIPRVQGAGWTVAESELTIEGIWLADREGTQNKALSDVRVRQAINYAIDRPALMKAVVGSYGTPTEQIFPTFSGSYDKSLDGTYGYDPAKAKALLAAAGYANGLSITMSSSPVLQTMYDLIGQELQNVGINVKYTSVAPGDFSGILAGKFQAFAVPLTQGPDWSVINMLVAPNATYNPFHASDPKVNALIAAIRSGSPATATQATTQLNQYLVQQAWFAPLYRQQALFAADSKTAFTMSETNVYPSLLSFQPKS